MKSSSNIFGKEERSSQSARYNESRALLFLLSEDLDTFFFSVNADVLGTDRHRRGREQEQEQEADVLLTGTSTMEKPDGATSAN